MSNIITLYDIPYKTAGISWSPNIRKTRYCLNYKGLAYKTVWVEYPDIEGVCKEIGAPPTGKKADGSPYYTLPVIHDPSTGSTVSDSILIAEYLDSAYPATSKIIPEGTNVFQHLYLDAFAPAIGGMYPFTLPASVVTLNPSSEEYFNRTKGIPLFGKTLQELLPKGETYEAGWQNLVNGFAAVDAVWAAGKLEGPFVMGDTISFGDFAFGAYIKWMKNVFGEDSAEWKKFKTLNGGRWDRLVNALDKYEIAV